MSVPTEDDDDRGGDPFGPPAIPTLVACLHCGDEYESYLIERRRDRDSDGRMRWWWCCPTPGCGGRGFGFDILPIDQDWTDEEGNRMWVDDDDDDEEGEFDLGLDDDDDDDDPPDWNRPRKGGDDDHPIPY
jgi:hypothetical protein